MQKTTLYIGLFDKETKRQRFTTLEAYKLVESIVLSQLDGATISESTGIYKHIDGTVVIEPGLRIELLYTTPEKVGAIVGAIKVALNQESILVEETDVTVNFN